MKVVSWNVNGLRKFRPLGDMFKQLNADILCFQETRVSGEWDDSLESLAFVAGYDSFFSICKEKRGYSGVATFCRRGVATPWNAGEGLRSKVGGASISFNEAGACGSCKFEVCPCEGKGCSEESMSLIEDEGRCVITDHGLFVLVNVYIPAVSVEGRSAFKMQFLHALLAKIEALRAKSRNVMVAGDFNICPSISDCAERIPQSLHMEWAMRPSRCWFRNLLSSTGSDFVDSFKEKHPFKMNAYTCWSEMTRARENNHGVRIDLIVMNRSLFTRAVREADIEAGVMGSDHCPVTVSLSDTEFSGQVPKQPPPFCTKYMKRFSVRQQTLTNLFLNKSQRYANKDATTTESIRPTTQNPLVPQSNASKSPLGVASKRQIRKGKEKPKNHTNLGLLSSPRFSDSASKKHDTLPPGSSKQSSVKSDENLWSSTQKADSDRKKETALAWRKLLKGPPPPPLCRHGERCVLKTVLKPGENKGKTFFSCPYPAGEGLNANCKFFKWAPFKAGNGVLPY